MKKEFPRIKRHHYFFMGILVLAVALSVLLGGCGGPDPWTTSMQGKFNNLKLSAAVTTTPSGYDYSKTVGEQYTTNIVLKLYQG